MEVATLAELGTAVGTLVLAIATFAAVRSGNRSTLLTERSLLAAIRPLLVSSRLLDDEQKVGFVDDHWVTVKGGRATAEAEHDAVYLTISLRNVGTGLAILNGWRFFEERQLDVTAGAVAGRVPPAHPRHLHRAAGDRVLAGRLP